MKLALLIPHYNQADLLSSVLAGLDQYDLPCLVVDDGSNSVNQKILQTSVAQYEWVQLYQCHENGGKGTAFHIGCAILAEQGYTHVLQIDADGQHNLADLPRFIDAATKHPAALINGIPVYDASVPKSRYYGRKITNFWVAVETWSCQIKDAMCGFRLYPLAATLAVLQTNMIESRMAFDIDIIVRLYWADVAIVSVPTTVIYPQDGISHFDMLADNAKISLTHTKLFFGMLQRIPVKLLKREQRQQHWASITERGSMLGMRFTSACYRYFGKYIARLLLYPIIGYFYWTNRTTRAASKQYLARIAKLKPQPKPMSSFTHMLSFGQKCIDTLAVWHGEITMENINFANIERYQHSLQQGGVILTAHIGNMEVARCLARFHPGVKINALVFQKHASKFNAIIEQINADASLNIIEASEIDVATTMLIQDKVAAGEFIVIMADRISVNAPDRILSVDVLGAAANLPEGPFILSALLNCPVYFMLCVKSEGDRFDIIFENLAEKFSLPRHERQAALQRYAQLYADLLSEYSLRYPLQWFNFFDFWQQIPPHITGDEVRQ